MNFRIPDTTGKPKTLSQILEGGARARHTNGKTYSRFIRWMRIVLPLIAVGIISLLFAWPRVDATFEAIPKENILPQSIGQNELLKPEFRSQDAKGQPFTITADRAEQDSQNPDEVRLTYPKAALILTDQTQLNAEADNGTYTQNNEKLLLEGHVKLRHDQGYELNTEKMLVDIRKDTAWSDQPVSGHGPAGTLKATGMQADNGAALLIFTGPAHLTLNREVKGIE